MFQRSWSSPRAVCPSSETAPFQGRSFSTKEHLFQCGEPSSAIHTVITADEMSGANLANGDLLNAAEAHNFEVLVTTDKNLRFQQNLAGRKIAIFVWPTTSWPRLRLHAVALRSAIVAITPGKFVEWILP